MFYVGLDIHSKRISVCVLSGTGQVVRRCQVRTIQEMMRILESLPERFEVCYEASCVATTTTYYVRWLRGSRSRIRVNCG